MILQTSARFRGYIWCLACGAWLFTPFPPVSFTWYNVPVADRAWIISWDEANVGIKMACAPSPSHHHSWYKLTTPMGGKHGIVISALHLLLKHARQNSPRRSACNSPLALDESLRRSQIRLQLYGKCYQQRVGYVCLYDQTNISQCFLKWILQYFTIYIIEGSLETKAPTICTDEKHHSQEEAEPGRNSDV